MKPFLKQLFTGGKDEMPHARLLVVTDMTLFCSQDVPELQHLAALNGITGLLGSEQGMFLVSYLQAKHSYKNKSNPRGKYFCRLFALCRYFFFVQCNRSGKRGGIIINNPCGDLWWHCLDILICITYPDDVLSISKRYLSSHLIFVLCWQAETLSPQRCNSLVKWTL